MPLSNRIKNQHLLWRSAFGPMAENVSELDTLSQKQLWGLLVKTSSSSPVKIGIAQNLVDGFFKGVKDVVEMQKKEIDAAKRKKIREQSREDLKNLNIKCPNDNKHQIDSEGIRLLSCVNSNGRILLFDKTKKIDCIITKTDFEIIYI